MGPFMKFFKHVLSGAKRVVVIGASLAIALPIVAFVIMPETATASSVPPTCSYNQLEVAIAWGPGGAAGNVGTPFIIVNKSKSACTLMGYPRLRLFTAAANKTPIRVGFNATGGVYRYVKPKLTVIAPHSVATFGMDFVDVMNQQDTNGPRCTAQTVNVYLPVTRNHYGQGYETVVNFNICYSGFRVSVTSIESGPVPAQG
ncbi:MAG: DUF4232 domain-containing protein [Acidimicrobiales bacterium]